MNGDGLRSAAEAFAAGKRLWLPLDQKQTASVRGKGNGAPAAAARDDKSAFPAQGEAFAFFQDVIAESAREGDPHHSNFNNPDGSVIPDVAKEEIVRLLARKAIPLIEDDICGDLHFGPNRPQVCKKYDRNGMVMLCSSFSKTIAPGYRVGWLIPGKFHEKAKILKGDTSVCTASPSQVVIAEFLRAGRHERHLKRLRNAIARHMQTLQLAVVRYFPPETRITRPTGGGLLWLELPKGVDSRDFFFQAYAQGIGVVPGLICSTSDRFRNFIRLSCSGVWNKETEKGIETLGQLAAHLAR